MREFNHLEVVSILKRSCLNKVPLTLEQANQYVDDKTDIGSVMYYYKCELCNSYHATSKEPFGGDIIKFI